MRRAAALAVIAVLGLPTIAAAAPDQAIHTGARIERLGPAGLGRDRSPQLRIHRLTPVVPPEGTLRFTVRLRGALPGDRLGWTVHSVAENDPEAVRAALQDDPGPPLRSEVRVPLSEVLRRGAIPVTIPVRAAPGDPNRVFLPDAGVYPVVVRWLRDDDTVARRVIPLIRLPTEPTGPGRTVHLVRSVVGDELISANGDEPTRPGTTLARLIEQLRGVDDADPNATGHPPLSIALAPGTIAPPDDEQLAALRSVADRATWLPTTWVPVDHGGWAAADVAGNPELSLEGAAGESTVTAWTDRESFAPLAGPTESMGADSIGFLAERDRKGVFVRTSPAESGTAVPLSLAGTRSPTELRPERASEIPNDAEAPSESVTLPGIRLLDASNNGSSEGDSSEGDAADAALAVAIASASAFEAQIDQDNTAGSPIALPVPAGLSRAGMADLLSSISAAHGLLRPVDAPTLLVEATLGEDRSTIVLPDTTVAESLGDREWSVYRTQQSLNAAAAMSGESTPQVAQQLLLSALDRSISLADSNRRIAESRKRAERLLFAVTMAPLDPITIAARRTVLPIRLDNTADVPLSVDLSIRSERLKLTGPTVDDRLRVLVPPGGLTQRLAVEVATSGVFDATIELRPPRTDLVVGRRRTQIRSRAFSGVGVALSVVSLAVLLLWWIRTARRGRIDRAESPEP